MTFRRYLTGVAPIALADLPPASAVLEPSAAWTGTAGSGFAAVPSDPTRTTAKPTCRLVTVPNQRFTDTHEVGVMAFANYNDTLIGGLTAVRFHFEGRTIDVTQPSLRTFTRMDGSTYHVFGYWVVLKKPAGQTGAARLYAEAIPADPTMQRRVIGPFTYGLETTLHDYQIEVAATPAEVPGSRYKTFLAAINYLKGVGAQAPRITCTETGTYLMTDSGVQYDFPNWLTITVADGVTCTCGRASYLGDAASRFNLFAGNVCFRGLTFDMRYVSSIQSVGNDLYWADRCTITNSDPEGSYSKWRGQFRPIGYIFESTESAQNGTGYLTDNTITKIPNALGADTALARGNLVSDGCADCAGDVQCMTGNVIRNWDSSAWLLGEDAFTVTYAGAQATATLSAPIAQGATRVLTATWGSNTATLTIGRNEVDWRADDTGFTPPSDNAFWPRDVVNWINGTGPYAGIGLKDQDAGWSAALLDDTICAFFVNLDRTDPEFSGGANGNASAMNVSVKAVTKTIKCTFDIHADGYQQRFGGTNNNVIICNESWEVAGQLLFLSANDQEEYDYTIVNNGFKFLSTAAEYIEPESNLGRMDKNHVLICHNSWANQRLRVRYDSGVSIDSYSLIANNVMEELTDVGTSDTPVGIIINNHIYAGSALAGGQSGTTIGGDASTLFANITSATDFTPAGALLTNLAAPVMARDAGGVLRPALAPKGARA